MLTQNQVNSLRDLALEHLPEVRALSKELYSKHHDSRAALQVVAFAPDLVTNSPLSTTANKLAGQLIQLVGQHPETLTEHLIDKLNDGSLGITPEDAHRWAMRDRPNTETLLIETARSLCEISGATLPPWVQAESEKVEPVQSNATPAPIVFAEAAAVCEKPRAIDGPQFSMRKAALIAAHIHEWPTIERDIADASANGLAVAKHGARGWWEAVAMDWARAKGKLKGVEKPSTVLVQSMHTMASIPGRKHTMEG